MKSARAALAATTLSALLFGFFVVPAAHGQAAQELVVGFTVDVQTLDPRVVFTTQGGSILLTLA